MKVVTLFSRPFFSVNRTFVCC